MPEHIITTVGATHALDIVSRTLLRPGDPVMVEEPGWAVEFARLAALGMRILPVPRRADGPDLEVMARYCEVHQPKLYVSVSVFHNPTGYCLSPGSAHRVLQLANQHNFHVVEDDTYSHIAPEHATRLTALDGLQRTIYVSGFAKILAPNWRIGYLAAPPNLVEPLLDTKLLATLTTPALLEKAWPCASSKGSCAAMPSASAPGWMPPGHAASSWRCKPAALLRQSRWACSAGSIRAWTLMPWPSACWTRATCWLPARCSMPSANPARSCASTLPPRRKRPSGKSSSRWWQR